MAAMASKRISSMDSRANKSTSSVPNVYDFDSSDRSGSSYQSCRETTSIVQGRYDRYSAKGIDH